MSAYFGQPISTRISATPEGFLIAQGARLCRSGWQPYRASELNLGGSEVIEVYRPKSEVTAPTFLASLEGKCLINDHNAWISADNARWYCAGHIQNVREGEPIDGEVCIIGDVIVTDADVIKKIRSGKRELSVGYHYNLAKRADGSYEMRDLVANHVALVNMARAGHEVRILDHAFTPTERIPACPREIQRIESYRVDPEIASINFVAATRRYLGRDVMSVPQPAGRRKGLFND